MKGYYRKIFIYVFCTLVIAAVLMLINSGRLIERQGYALQDTTIEPVNAASQEEMTQSRQTALILYDEQEDASVKYKGNFERVLHRMDMEGEFLDIRQKESVSYSDFNMVAVIFSDWDGLIGEDCYRMLRYVQQGGRLFLGMVPASPGTVYSALYRAMGIVEYGEYVTTTGITFTEELLAGSKGRAFKGDSFEDAAIGVQIETGAQLYATGTVEDRQVPLVWKNQYGEGDILVFNATGITGDLWTGVLGGCVATAMGDFIYPVINTKTVFIDDFPSPMYNTESAVIAENYNRSVQEFFRDIWWPDMQSAASRYNLEYVGLFIATYDNIVVPENFAYTKDTVEQYFGNSLLQNGFEMGGHGYNHQSLALEGQVPKDMGYKAWSGEADMAASLTKLREIAEDLFPGVKLYTYVPPSNYLSAEGREAVKEALPDLQVISGVYTMEGEEGSVYVQDFTVADDGIVEFPRATSGMLEGVYDDFAAMNIAGLYGVYSHFIHPDDILDEERGGGKDWESLFSDFCEKLSLINAYFPQLRPMTSAEAAQQVRVAEALDIALTLSGGRATGVCNGFTGEAWCYLRTDKTPAVDNESCTITPVCGAYDGSYYLVQIHDANFSFSLQ